MSQIIQEFWRSDLPQESERTIARIALSKGADAVLMPTLGSQIPYHLLMFPETEARSWMELPFEELRAGLDFGRVVATELHDRRSDILDEFVLSEHGSAACVTSASACVSHAHFHLVPVGSNRSELLKLHVRAGGEPSIVADLDSEEGLSSLQAACKGHDYILFSPDLHTANVWFNTHHFGSQFIRRAAAQCLGAPAVETDWRRNTFEARMQFTAESLRPLVGEIIEQRLPHVKSEANLGIPPLKLITGPPPFQLGALDYSNPYRAIDLCGSPEALLEFALSPNEYWAEAAFDRLRSILIDGAKWGTEFMSVLKSQAERLAVESPSRLVQQAAGQLAAYLNN